MAAVPPDRFRRILVIKWGALGDLLAGTTAIRALREALPTAFISLLSNPLMGEICPPGTLADELIAYDERRDRFGVVRTLRRRRYDLAVNLRWTSERSALLALLSGAKERAGSGPASFRMFYTLKPAARTGRRHEFLRNIDIIEAVGITPRRILPFLAIPPEALHTAAAIFDSPGMRKEATVGMHPGASKPSKAWPAEAYGECARRLAKKYRVIVTWGPGEHALAEDVATRGGTGVVLAPPTPAIGGLAAIIARCGVFVCNYSGPMNVAMAVETPLVALGSTSPEDWGPYGEIHRTINKCGERDSYTEGEQRAMMERIGVDEVVELVGGRMKQLYGTNGDE